MTLEALFEKTNYATDKLKHHSYIPVYDKLFGPIRNQVSNVLEIGIGSGGSLQLWHDYFLKAQIYGIDRGYVREGLNRFDRIHQIISDAYTAECVEYFKTNNIQLDIVIDDGPHNKRSQMLAMELYFPLLSDNGIIVIEDVQDYLAPGVWIKDIVGSLPPAYQKYAEVIDLRHFNKSPDDLMVILDKSRASFDETENQ